MENHVVFGPFPAQFKPGARSLWEAIYPDMESAVEVAEAIRDGEFLGNIRHGLCIVSAHRGGFGFGEKAPVGQALLRVIWNKKEISPDAV